jgi:beta-glucosidase
LNAGEAKQITFRLPVNQLAYYDHDLHLILESGTIQVMVGSSSQDIRLSGQMEIIGKPKMIVDERVFFCPVFVE